MPLFCAGKPQAVSLFTFSHFGNRGRFLNWHFCCWETAGGFFFHIFAFWKPQAVSFFTFSHFGNRRRFLFPTFSRWETAGGFHFLTSPSWETASGFPHALNSKLHKQVPISSLSNQNAPFLQHIYPPTHIPATTYTLKIMYYSLTSLYIEKLS